MGKIIAANWKMNNSFSDIEPYANGLRENAKELDNLIVCVPSTLINAFSLATKGLCETGAEDCFFEQKGAYTGEISAQMVKDAGAKWCIVGHSERRNVFDENNETINKKLKAVLDSDLKAIFCIGEKLEDRENFETVLKTQIVDGFDGIENFDGIVIAYEPVWAIGTGVVATVSDIKKVHAFIKNFVKENYNVDVKILYGGSVKPSNSAEILALSEVDGVLIGGASLNVDDYLAIAKSR